MGTAPWLILLAVLVYSVVHSLLASLTLKSWAQRTFGPVSHRAFRLVYNIFAILTLLPVLALPALLPDQTLYSIPFPWVVGTILVQVLAVTGLAIGVFQTGLWSFLGFQQALKPPDRNSASPLVVRGLYRCVRHPLYTAGLIILWLIPVMTVNLLALVIGLSLYLIIGAIFEERKLLHEYGAAYAQYRQETPMLLPCLHLLRRHGQEEMDRR